MSDKKVVLTVNRLTNDGTLSEYLEERDNGKFFYQCYNLSSKVWSKKKIFREQNLEKQHPHLHNKLKRIKEGGVI